MNVGGARAGGVADGKEEERTGDVLLNEMQAPSKRSEGRTEDATQVSCLQYSSSVPYL